MLKQALKELFNYLLVIVLGFTAGYIVALKVEKAKTEKSVNYDSKGLGDITAMYSNVSDLKFDKTDCIDCGRVR